MKTPKVPKPEKAVVLPTADDEALEKAKKNRIIKEGKTSGRASTLLSDNEGNNLG